MEINTSFPKAQRFDNHPDVLGFEDLGIHCWYVEVKNDELGVVKESFKGKGQILTRYWELYLQDRKYTAASSPLPHKVGEEEFCDRGKSHAQTHDHRKTVFMYLHKEKTTDDITSDCESGTACGPFIHMFHLLLFWSVPECDDCVHTAQTNHTIRVQFKPTKHCRCENTLNPLLHEL